jgi:hypothetical protein
MSSKTNLPLGRRREPRPLQGGQRSLGVIERVPDQRRRQVLAGALSAAINAIVIAALFWSHAQPPSPQPAPRDLVVNLQATPVPPSPPQPVAIKAGSPLIALPLTLLSVPTLPRAATATPDTSDLLTEAQLAGATTVGEGGGGACDMARFVQQALRRDPLVRAAVEEAHRSGQAIMLWNGDWVRTGDQDGKGLSAVREAIMWEVAFAPEACRNTRVHGLVLLSLADGGTRFALGSGDWRWSDLLGIRAIQSDH